MKIRTKLLLLLLLLLASLVMSLAFVFGNIIFWSARVAGPIITSALFVTIVITISFFWIYRDVTSRLTEFYNGVKRIMGGDFGYKIEVRNHDEIGELAQSFNELAAKSAIFSVSFAEARAKEEAFLQSIGDGIASIDRNWIITGWNNAASAISGWPAEKVVGRQFREVMKLIREQDRKESFTFIEEAMVVGETRQMDKDILLVRRDGSEIHVGDSASPVFDENHKVIGAVIVFRDMDKETKLEHSKNDFISIVSHQLRTPPTVIKGYLQLFTDEVAPQLEEKQKEYLREMHTANELMIDLANALMNVFRIDFGEFAILPQPVDITEIGDQVFGQFTLQAEGKKLKLEKNYDKNIPILSIDPKLTVLIISNLLSNAVKYTPDGGSIKLTMHKRDNDVLVQVSDTGSGIPKDEQAKMFTKFFRAGNISQKIEGTGLGLYIVKRVIEESGGKIWFESEENKGTTFYVSIPLSGMLRREGAKGLT